MKYMNQSKKNCFVILVIIFIAFIHLFFNKFDLFHNFKCKEFRNNVKIKRHLKLTSLCSLIFCRRIKTFVLESARRYLGFLPSLLEFLPFH